MLQNNHLYRRIQHKNIFRTFSRAYTRQNYKQQALNRIKMNIKGSQNNENRSSSSFNNQDYQHKDSLKTMNGVCSSRQESYKHCRTIDVGYNSVKKSNANETVRMNTMEIPFENNKFMLTRNYQTQKNYTIGSDNEMIGSLLPKWNKRKRDQIFKLKSCQVNNFDGYEQPASYGSQFSTLECKLQKYQNKQSAIKYNLKKRSTKQNRSSHKNNLDDSAFNFGSGSKGSFLLSKYCRFLTTASNIKKQASDGKQKQKSQN